MPELILQKPIETLQTFVLLVTAVVILWYTIETYRLRKVAEHQTKSQLDAHTFDAITRVCQILSNRDAIRRRRWLYKRFEKDWQNALQYVEGKPPTTEVFNHALKRQFDVYPEGRYDPLENVEGVLADLNVLGISCRLGIEAAGRVAEEYKPVIEKTAPFLLRFVKKQRQLRNEPAYKREYVALLQSFDLLNKNGPLAEYADMASQA